MKTLVVYYSRTGNTRKVGEAIAAELGAEVEEIGTLKDRAGVKGWLLAGRDATLKHATPIEPAKKDASAYDLVIVGTPVWAFTMASPVRTYLQANGGKLRAAAFFCTLGGSGSNRTFRDMQDVAGKTATATLALTEKQLAAGFAAQVKAFAAEAAAKK